MSNTILLSLQASSNPDPDQDSLQSLIARINEQRGSFRDVTEEGLEEEIRRGESQENNDAEDDEAPAADEEARSRPELLAAARESMLRQVGSDISKEQSVWIADRTSGKPTPIAHKPWTSYPYSSRGTRQYKHSRH